MKVPFNRPSLVGHELEFVQDAVASGQISCSGKYSDSVSSLLAEELDVADVLLTTSCTDALEMAALLLDLGPGDTVIVPSFTFVSTALAFVRTGAELVFADIDRETLGIDLHHATELIDERTRAVVGVHYAGIPADPEGFARMCASHDITYVEDNAHGLFATEHGRPLGSFGRFATLSFHETKNFICGEGGALLLNDEADIDRAHVLLDKGTDRRKFMQGLVDKYSWKDTGSSFGLSDLLAAYLLAQLEERESVLARRGRVSKAYEDRLRDPLESLGVELVRRRTRGVDAQHMFAMVLPNREVRDAVLDGLRSRGVMATFHYVPLHTSEAGQRFSARPSECPVTTDISGRLLRLPFFTDLDEPTIDRVSTLVVEELHSAISQRRTA